MPIVATDADPHGLAAGRLPGVGDVAWDGAATYSLPLWLPRGRGAMVPTLTLDYNSRRGNGILGVGWTLGGSSQITRCRRTLLDDGEPCQVMFDDSDAFALDGARLVATEPTHQTHPQQREFRTQMDTHAKIVALADDAYGPQAFQMYASDGRIFTYGSLSEDYTNYLQGPRFTFGQGSTPASPHTEDVRYAWALSMIEDRSGNSITFKYQPLAANGGCSLLLREIEYTGSSVPGSPPPTRRVEFGYANRQDASQSYVSGFCLVVTQLLENIRVDYLPPDGSPAVPVRTYTFEYDRGANTGRSRLRGVRATDGAGVSLPVTRFNWTDQQLAFADQIANGLVSSDVLAAVAAGAASADGAPWIVSADLAGCGTWTVVSGLDPFPDPADPGSFIAPSTFGRVDLNGDGVPDTMDVTLVDDLPVGEVSGNIYVGQFTVGGRTETEAPTVAPPMLCAADLIGDGLPEVIVLTPTGSGASAMQVTDIWRLTAEGQLTNSDPAVALWGEALPEFWTIPPTSETEIASGAREPSPGIGLSLLGVTGPQQEVVRREAYAGGGEQSYGSGPVVESPGYGATGQFPFLPPVAIDLNGSGKTSLVWGGTVLSSGSRPASTNVPLFPGVLADLNGDGLMDFVTVGGTGAADGQQAAGTGLLVYVNTGTGFYQVPASPIDVGAPYATSPSLNASSWTGTGYTPALDGVRAVDIDGDGCDELLVMGGYSPNSGAANELFYLKWTGTTLEPFALPLPAGQSSGALANIYQPLQGQWRCSQIFKGTVDNSGQLVNGGATDGLPGFLQIVEGKLHIYHQTGVQPDLISAIVDGLGATTAFDYGPICEPTICTPTRPSRFPIRVLTGGLWAVSELAIDAGGGATRHYRFAYESAMADIAGRGWLGFAKRTARVVEREAEIVTTFASSSQVGTWYPFRGLPTKEITTIKVDQRTLRRRVTSYRYLVRQKADRPFYFPFVAESRTALFEAVGDNPFGCLAEVVTVITVDDYGNPLSVTTDTYGCEKGAPWGRAARRILLTDYDNFPVTWLIGQQYRVRDIAITRDGRTATRTTAYRHHADTGLVSVIEVEPDERYSSSSAVHLATAMTYDRYGQVMSVTRTALGQARTDKTSYDQASELFPSIMTNALGQATTYTYDPGLGLLDTVTDPNGLTTTLTYDGFGRLRETQAPGGMSIAVHYLGTWAAALPLTVTTDRSGYPSIEVGYDKLARPVAYSWERFDGEWVASNVTYDLLGRSVLVTYPATAAEAAAQRAYTWDNLDRLTTVTDTGVPATSFEYSELSVSRTDPEGNVTERVFNALGRLTTVREWLDGQTALVTRYRYEPFGALERVTDPLGHTPLEVDYDVIGRPVLAHDSDAGATCTQWNGFGDVLKQTFADGSTTTYTVDALGRTLARTDSSGLASFEWDTATNGIGALAATLSPDGVGVTYGYDGAGRCNAATYAYAGATYTVTYGYDADGRLNLVEYPAGAGGAFTTPLAYNRAGYLAEIKDGSGNSLWLCQDRDSSGRLLKEEFGNGVVSQRAYTPIGWTTRIQTISTAGPIQNHAYAYDNNGNVTQRTAELPDGTAINEAFTYDGLQRLATWDDGNQLYGYAYDAVSDLAALELRGGFGQFVITSYRYGQVGAGEHAVTSATVGLGVLGHQAASYHYDGRGDQIQASNRVVEFTSFGLPSQVTVGTGASALIETFAYDALCTRIAKANTEMTTVYVPELYELRQAAGASNSVYYLRLGARVLGQYTIPANGQPSMVYLHDDDLASIVVASDDAGDALGSYTYEPFGGRAVAWAAPSRGSASVLDQVHRGFTGHEHDDELGLINMRGRMMDPALGSFISADPYVSDPLTSKGYNRYRYAESNPLNVRDLSGFQSSGGDGEGDDDGGGQPSADDNATNSTITSDDLCHSCDFPAAAITAPPPPPPPPPPPSATSAGPPAAPSAPPAATPPGTSGGPSTGSPGPVGSDSTGPQGGGGPPPATPAAPPPTPPRAPGTAPPSGGGTLQVGVGGSMTVFGVSVSTQTGIAVDRQGTVAVYSTNGAGGAPPLTAAQFFTFDGSVAINVDVSNAPTVTDLGGVFGSVTASGGAGGHLGADTFFGDSQHGAVVGGGLNFGFGLGASVNVGATNTVVVTMPAIANAVDSWLSAVIGGIAASQGAPP